MHIGLTLSLFCLQILRGPLSPKTELLTETPLPVSGSNTLYMEGKGWCWYLLSRGQGQTLPKIQDRGYPTPLPRKNHPTLNYACQVVKSSSRRYISPQHEAACRAHHCQVHASLHTCLLFLATARLLSVLFRRSPDPRQGSGKLLFLHPRIHFPTQFVSLANL